LGGTTASDLSANEDRSTASLTAFEPGKIFSQIAIARSAGRTLILLEPLDLLAGRLMHSSL
jgi:hypothetical protein